MMKLPAAVICLLAVLICGFTNASAPITLTDATFQTELEKGDFMMVEFWAEWDASSRRMAPVIDELAEEYDGQLKIYKMNIDENQVIPVTYGVYSIPTLLFFKMGQEVYTVLGDQPKSKIANIIDYLM